jgi:2-iminobutanoate/2-iminopropanoate deaminase
MKRVPVEGLSAAPLTAATVVGDVVFTSGQVGRDGATGVVPIGLEEQIRLGIANLGLVLDQAGASLADVVKVGVYLTRADDFAVLNEVYRDMIPEPYPARTTTVCALAHPELRFEIDAVAEVRDR